MLPLLRGAYAQNQPTTPAPLLIMSRKKEHTCAYCQTVYRSAACPHCRAERLAMQSTYQPDWDGPPSRLREERDRKNNILPRYDYDSGIEDGYFYSNY